MLFAWNITFATHNRAGEITYRQVGGKNTYEATLITYTDTRSKSADRPVITLDWGDGTNSSITRQSQITLPNYIWKNTYVDTHVYAGPGQYAISFEDPNRVASVINMTGSLNTPFFIESLLIIDPLQGFDQSPVLLNPPIDNACDLQIYNENPDAHDQDGDSLAYSLIPPKQAHNVDVSGYYTPQGFVLDKHTGQITWTTPKEIGIYNVAILIKEYRFGKMIGYIIRDMQINVLACPPIIAVISPLQDICIEAGHNIDYKLPVKATVDSITKKGAIIQIDSPLKFPITLSAYGGPFLQTVQPATLNIATPPAPGYYYDSIKGIFEWRVSCEHIRNQPYLVVFKASTTADGVDSITDVKSMQIRVVGPAPNVLTAKPAGNSVILSWHPPDCPNPVGYFIYRRADTSTWQHAICEIGVPGYVGYQQIKRLNSPKDTTFIDDNNGNDLSPGIRYCYLVTAIYLNAGQFEIVEGYASNEACAELKKDVPVLTHASVRVTSASNGSMYIDWSKPVAKDLDTNQNPGPYMYKLYRSPGTNTTNFTLISSSTSPDFYGLNDTTYIDTMLNTEGSAYTYKVEFYITSVVTGKLTLLGKTISAASVYLHIGRGYKSMILNWDVKVPWQNSYYVIYRKNNIPVPPTWDSIAEVNGSTLSYTDTGLINGKPYCYYIKSHGSYVSPGFTDPIINFSETMCSSPRDTVKPCPPHLTGAADCDARSTSLAWNIFDSCTTKVTRYKIYYAVGNSYKFGFVDSLMGRSSSNYVDQRRLLQHSLAGCYYITAIDSYDNESLHSNYLCVDNCPVYELPNVFTPNGDEINDLFGPMPGYRFIDTIDLKVYNRWGQEVFSTTDPAINWDGTDENSHLPLSDGAYYYYCIVKEIYWAGLQNLILRGAVTIIRNKH